MVTRRSFALLFVLAALPACGALIGVKSLVEPDDDAGGAQVGPDAGDALATTDALGPDGGGDASCGDVTQSKDHCGRCGHSCLGGECKASTCQPTTLATGQGEVYGVALDATHVYFTSFTSNLVARVPKAGGKVETITSTGAFLARKVAVNATHVYWSADDSPGVVSRCLVSGCAGGPEVLATPQRPFGLALDSTSVYWADRNSTELRRRPLGGGAEVHVADSTAGLPIAIAVDQSQVFWIGDFTGEVEGRAADGGTFSVGKGGTSGRDLVLDGTFVYWGAAIDLGQDGRISRAPRSGAGPTETIGAAKGEPMSLAVDGKRVYWTAWDRKADGGVVTAGVYACAPTGCGAGPTTLAAGQDLPRGIALDDGAIYWGANGVVMKLAKP
ncbi:hypothetical protein BH11MYX4_BH11MYX4_44360 [soil metagenome]